jgi:hypothetical protein
MGYNLENSVPLLEEIKRRIGHNWEPLPNHEAVEAQGKLVFGKKWKSTPQFDEDEPLSVLQSMGGQHGVAHALQRMRAQEDLAKERSKKLKPFVDEAIQSLRSELRSGKYVAFERTSLGFNQPFREEVWDGTLANKWLEEGCYNGNEIRVAKVIAINPPTYTKSKKRGVEYPPILWLDPAQKHVKRNADRPFKNRAALILFVVKTDVTHSKGHILSVTSDATAGRIADDLISRCPELSEKKYSPKNSKDQKTANEPI